MQDKPTTCMVPEGCNRAAEKRGMCGKHYRQAQRGNRPFVLPSSVLPTLEERFWAKVDCSDPNGCWPWTGGLDTSGYGTFQGQSGKNASAHSFLIGKAPKGMQWDHLCHSEADPPCAGGVNCLHRRCVNPAHLQAVPRKVNIQRGKNVALKTECAQGHPWIPENIRRCANGTQRCLICERERYEAFYADPANREAVLARMRDYYTANREARLAYERNKRQANR